MQYINTLHEGEQLSEIYFCKSKTAGTTKAGRTYYSMVLQDKTGTIDAKIWELNNYIDHFEAMDYIMIDGQVTSFNNALQLNVKRVRKAHEGEVDVADYMPCTTKNIDEMYTKLVGIINSVEEPHLHAVLSSFFIEDEKFAKQFKKNSAAKTVHHGFIGGLLQHTLAVAEMCDFLAKAYPTLNRDLLLTAAICHDIGKTEEISDFPENDYTDSGNLLGHIVIGAMMVQDKIRAIDGFPKVLGNELVHCILSHHGELEYGSPKKPELMEALALSMADNLDAKMETFTELLDKNPEKEDWIGYNKMLEANLRRTVTES